MSRPFFSARIDDLEALARDQTTPLDQMATLRSELDHRHTWRAQKLKRDLDKRLSKVSALPLAEPKKAAAPANDVKLTKFNLSTRARNVLTAHEITFASELAKMSGAELFRIPNVGRKTFHELRNILRSVGMDFGKCQSELSLEQSTHQTTAIFKIDEPKDLAGALRAHVDAASASERNSRWTIEHLGWDGEPGRTLESIGSASNVTRERVRQIAAKCSQLLAQRELVPQPLKRVVTLIRKSVPLTQSSLNAAMREGGLAEEGFHIEGIKTAAKVFGLGFPYHVVEGSDPLIIQEQLMEAPKAFLRSAKLEVAAYGAIVNDQLIELFREQTSCSVEPSFVHAILQADGTFARLKDCQEWWWRPSRAARGRNRLVNTITKVLAACPAIPLAELREACRRHVRTRHIAPPTRVLRAICSALPFLVVHDDVVKAVPNALDWDEVLGLSEKLLLRIFERRGLVVDSYTVSEEGIALGINENSLTIYKTYSPILWRPVPSYYSVVGSTIPLGLIEDLQRRKQRPTKTALEFGWTANHRMLLARRITDGVWLSGILSLPAAVQEVVQGDFSLVALGAHTMGIVSAREANMFGFKPFLRMFGADVGDVIVVIFDLRLKQCETWLGGSELSDMIQSGPDAILSYLSVGRTEVTG